MPFSPSEKFPEKLKIERRVKTVEIGNLKIGGDHPVSIQSMTTTSTADVEKTLAQIKKLNEAGCELIRLAVPDSEAVRALNSISSAVDAPLMADIHFNHRLALKALEAGIDGLRINPGNIGGRSEVREVVKACQNRGVPIRVGVNSGSLEDEIREKHGGPTAEAMVESAARQVDFLEDLGFEDYLVSLKSTDVRTNTAANLIFAQKYDCPLHIGITEAGFGRSGEIKSAVGMGSLLSRGVGDTMRVSLTGDPVREIEVGREILASLGERSFGPEVISCPTCGRTEIDIEKIAGEIKKALQNFSGELKVAVMGCSVNGPGEASQADIGLAGGRGTGLIFKEGEVIKKVPEEEMITALLQEIKQMECD